MTEFSKSAFGVVHSDVKQKVQQRNKTYDDNLAAGTAGIAGGYAGAAGGAGNATAFKNSVRAANHLSSSTGSRSFLTQAKAASKAPRLGRAGLGALVVGGGAAYGANKLVDHHDEVRQRLGEETDKLGTTGKVVLGGAALAVGAKGAHNFHGYREAARVSRMFANNPERAQKLAHDLSAVKGTKSTFDVNMKSHRQMRSPWNQQAHREALRQNRDTKKARKAFDSWSKNGRQVNSFRRSLNQQNEPALWRQFMDPKAKNWHQARTLRTLQDASPKTDAQLFRSTNMPKDTDFTPGGKLNVHHLSSWTEDSRIAENFSSKQTTRGKKGRRSGDVPTLLRMSGTQGALHGAPLSRDFAQREWLAGGDLKIKGVTTDKRGRRIVDVEH